MRAADHPAERAPRSGTGTEAPAPRRCPQTSGPGRAHGAARPASLLPEPSAAARWGAAEARGRGAKAAAAPAPASSLNPVSARPHPRRCPEAPGDTEKGPRGGAPAPGDRQADTHLDASPAPPAAQGSSSGRSARAQRRGISERGLASSSRASSGPPGRARTRVAAGLPPSLRPAARGLGSSGGGPRGA